MTKNNVACSKPTLNSVNGDDEKDEKTTIGKANRIFSEVLSGKISIIIYVLMFIYLVPIALIGLIPALSWLEPSANAMLIGDNYTSVLAALGASIAAGAGVATHRHIKKMNRRHAELEKSLAELHAKIDKLNADR
jgi:hypothetical protein